MRRKAPSRGAAFGDGDNDVLVTNSNSKAQLLRNDGANRKNWIKIQIVGETGDRSDIGTRVEVTCKSLVQIAAIKSGSSYLCQNDLTLYFGLDDHEVVDKITATFLNGSIYETKPVTVNQTIQIYKSGKYKSL